MKNNCRNCLTDSELSVIFSNDSVLQCAHCHGYQFVGPTGNISSLYTEDYYKGHEYINYELGADVYRLNFIKKWKNVHAKLSPNARNTPRLLEIGTATGEFLKVLRNLFEIIIG